MVPEAIRARSVDRLRNLDVLHLFPALGSAGRRFASLPRVLRGEFPCFGGTIKALRLPAAPPAALRCLRLAVPRRPLVRFAPRRTSAPPGPGVGNPVAPAGIIAEETTGSPRFPGNPDCPFAMFNRRRQDCCHQTATVQQRGPWYVKSRGSYERSFDSQSHGVRTRCLRFAGWVTPPRRKSRFQPLVRRYWTGFHPQGPYERFRGASYIPSS